MNQEENNPYVTPFEEITEDRFDDMYEVLPPYRIIAHDDGLFFGFIYGEFHTENVTLHFFRIQGRFFSARRKITESIGNMYAEIMTAFFLKPKS